MDFMSPTSLMSNTQSERPSLYIQMVFDRRYGYGRWPDNVVQDLLSMFVQLVEYCLDGF